MNDNQVPIWGCENAFKPHLGKILSKAFQPKSDPGFVVLEFASEEETNPSDGDTKKEVKLPSLGVDVKPMQVPQFYKYIGMKLDSVEACKYSQTAGEDTVRVNMDFEPVVELQDGSTD